MARSRAAPTRRRLVFACGVVPVILTVALAVYRPQFVVRLDDTMYDNLVRSAGTRPPTGRIVIVDVDERSLSTVGQWPWRRDLVARLIDRLRDLRPSIIALDIIFAEEDRFAPASARDATPDDVLAATLGKGGVVMGYGMTFEGGVRARSACVLHPVGLAVLHPREDTGEAPYFRATGVVCSLPHLARLAGASGFLNAAPDYDGILRRVPLLVEFDGRMYPSLALAAVSMTAGVRDMSLRIANVNGSSLRLDERSVPLDGKSNLLVRYRGKKRTFPYVSAADVMNGTVTASALRDKIVFVGTTALGTREVVATPLDTLFVGVEVQATVADNLLAQDFISRSDLGTTIESQAVLIVGIAIALLVARVGIVSGLLGGAVSIVAVWFGCLWLLSTRGLFVSPLSPILAVLAALAVMTLVKFAVERRRADSAGRERTAAQRLMVQSLLSLTETRDAETGRHSRRTQQYARLLAQELAQHPAYHDYLTEERIDLLSSLAPIHDIGKVGIPDHILNKPGPLTPEELAEMRKHPVLGRDVILKAQQQVGVRDDAILAMAKDIVYTHHERWDGAGYPQGLKGEAIPIPGRVMAIVDVYDATVARTLYRPTMTHQDAVKFITSGKGTHFDPAVVDAFLSVSHLIERISHEPDAATLQLQR